MIGHMRVTSSLALYDSNHDSIPGILRRDFQVSRTTLTDTKSTERGALNDQDDAALGARRSPTCVLTLNKG